MFLKWILSGITNGFGDIITFDITSVISPTAHLSVLGITGTSLWHWPRNKKSAASGPQVRFTNICRATDKESVGCNIIIFNLEKFLYSILHLFFILSAFFEYKVTPLTFFSVNSFQNNKFQIPPNRKSLLTTMFVESGRKFSNWEENTVGKRRNCSLRAISPFPTVFLKDLYCRHVKIRACLGRV